MGVVWALLLSLLALFSYQSSSKKLTVFDVTSYGAKGDGETNDAQAFLKAWEAVCSSNEENPGLVIPKGKNFLISAVDFAGPCKANSVAVVVMGNVIASTKEEDWKTCEDWVSFSRVRNLAVVGSGVFDGNGEKWWNNKPSCGKRPTNVAFNKCSRLYVSGIHSINSPRNHFSIHRVHGAIITGIKATAPEKSPNTDGMDISRSTFIHVRNSKFGSGDDCIAINNFCKNINITNIECGPGHGISVGSLGRNGEYARVEDIYVSNSKLIGTTNGARIKTWKDGRGYARRITFENIKLVDVRRPIIINQTYVDRHKINAEEESSVAINDVKFINFQGTCKDTDAITLGCSKTGPGCTNININNVSIRSKTGQPIEAKCMNAHLTASPNGLTSNARTLSCSSY